tara:strand:- start:470 stop:982 length:513 start_codon:yes stop_codon:yes gene_type:complete
MIKQTSDGWILYSRDGSKRLGGPYKSRDSAVQRGRQVQYFKHRKQASATFLDEIYTKFATVRDTSDNPKAVHKGSVSAGDLGRGVLFGAMSGVAGAAASTPEELKYNRELVRAAAGSTGDAEAKLKKVTAWGTFKSKAKRGVVGSAAGFGTYHILNEIYKHWYKPKYKNK